MAKEQEFTTSNVVHDTENICEENVSSGARPLDGREEFIFFSVHCLSTVQTVLSDSLLSLVTDYDKNALIIGDMSIPFFNFRYSFLTEIHSDKDILVISFISEDDQNKFIFLKEDKSLDTLKCQKALQGLLLRRYCIELSTEMVDKTFRDFFPLFHGWLVVDITESTDKESGKAEHYFCVMDKECLYLRNEDNSKQNHCLYFWRDNGPDVLETTIYNSSLACISLTSGRFIYTISEVTDKFLELTRGIGAVDHCCYGDPTFLKTLFGTKYRPMPVTSGNCSTLNVPHNPCMVQPFIDEKDNLQSQDLNTIIGHLEEATLTLRGHDALQPIWDSARCEMTQLQQLHLVPDDDMASGGMDENNEQHVISCMDVITRDLSEQQYVRALSHMQGCRNAFRNSNISSVQIILQKSDIELLEELFFYSYYS